MRETEASVLPQQHLVRRVLELLAALALVAGTLLIVLGVLEVGDDDRPTEELSPLFLERAKPAGDLFVVLEAPRDGRTQTVALSLLVHGPTRDEDPPRSVSVQLEQTGMPGTQSVELQPIHAPEHFQSAPLTLAAGRWHAEVTIERGDSTATASFTINVGERVRVS